MMPDQEDDEYDWTGRDELGFVFECAERIKARRFCRKKAQG